MKVFASISVIIIISTVLGVLYDFIHELNEVEKIDWHDWTLIEEENARHGLGQHGEPAYLSSYPAYTKDVNDTVGYNGYLSDKIALNRSLKDLRPPT